MKAWFVVFGLLGIGIWLLGFLGAWEAFLFPFELEAREGAWWHQALSRFYGVDVYSTLWVSCGLIGHGPMDSLLKLWIMKALAFIPGIPASPPEMFMVNRAFVPLVPLATLGTVFLMAGRRWIIAFWGAGMGYLAMLALGPFEFLVGRSDPSAMFFLILFTGLCYWAIAAGAETRMRAIYGAAVLSGVFAAASSLVIWRFLPGFLLIYLMSWLEMPRQRRWRFLVASLLAAAAFTCIILLYEFGPGFVRPYLQNYVLLFSRPPISFGWDKEWFFFHVYSGFAWAYLAFGFLVGYLFLVGRERRWRLCLQLCLIAFFFFVSNLGSFSVEGGNRYYAPLLPAFWLLLFVSWRSLADQPSGKLVTGFSFLVVFLAAVVPSEAPHAPGKTWVGRNWHQIQLQRESRAQAASFFGKLKEAVGGQSIYSEDLIYFHGRYESGAKAAFPWEWGDAGGKGDAAFYDKLEARPPAFILTSKVEYCLNARLSELIRSKYKPLLEGPPHFFYNAPNHGSVLLGRTN